MAGEPLDRIAVLNPAGAQRRENLGNLRKWLEAEIEIHQALAQARRFEAEAVEGEVERIAGDLPEVGVAVLQAAQPGVLKLLVAPQRRQAHALFRRHVVAPRRGGSEVEQRSIGVENAGADAFEEKRSWFGHSRLQRNCIPTPPDRRSEKACLPTGADHVPGPGKPQEKEATSARSAVPADRADVALRLALALPSDDSRAP